MKSVEMINLPSMGGACGAARTAATSIRRIRSVDKGSQQIGCDVTPSDNILGRYGENSRVAMPWYEGGVCCGLYGRDWRLQVPSPASDVSRDAPS